MSTRNRSAKPAVKAASRREGLPAELSRVNIGAAGVDVGASSHFVAVPENSCEQPVREFAAFTADLYRLADWLAGCSVETVAMESTGVYWIPLFGVLEERGFQVMLVDSRRIKNVPGRKSDVLDCQWLQQLHTYGLLSAAFRPEADIRCLRSYLRHRAIPDLPVMSLMTCWSFTFIWVSALCMCWMWWAAYSASMDRCRR